VSPSFSNATGYTRPTLWKEYSVFQSSSNTTSYIKPTVWKQIDQSTSYSSTISYTKPTVWKHIDLSTSSPSTTSFTRPLLSEHSNVFQTNPSSVYMNRPTLLNKPKFSLQKNSSIVSDDFSTAALKHMNELRSEKQLGRVSISSELENAAKKEVDRIVKQG